MLILVPMEGAYRYITISDAIVSDAVVIDKVERKSWRRSGQNTRRYYLVGYTAKSSNGEGLKVVAPMSVSSNNYLNYERGAKIRVHYFPQTPKKPFYDLRMPKRGFVMSMIGGAVTLLWLWWYILIFRSRQSQESIK